VLSNSGENLVKLHRIKHKKNKLNIFRAINVFFLYILGLDMLAARCRLYSGLHDLLTSKCLEIESIL
jgi:hypothetical protein